MALPTISAEDVSRAVLLPETAKKWAAGSVLTMSDNQRELLLSPATRDSVDVTAADTAALDLNVDIVVTKGLGVELVLVEFGPAVRALDLEARELFWVRHFWSLFSVNVWEGCLWNGKLAKPI